MPDDVRRMAFGVELAFFFSVYVCYVRLLIGTCMGIADEPAHLNVTLFPGTQNFEFRQFNSRVMLTGGKHGFNYIAVDVLGDRNRHLRKRESGGMPSS